MVAIHPMETIVKMSSLLLPWCCTLGTALTWNPENKTNQETYINNKLNMKKLKLHQLDDYTLGCVQQLHGTWLSLFIHANTGSWLINEYPNNCNALYTKSMTY